MLIPCSCFRIEALLFSFTNLGPVRLSFPCVPLTRVPTEVGPPCFSFLMLTGNCTGEPLVSLFSTTSGAVNTAVRIAHLWLKRTKPDLVPSDRVSTPISQSRPWREFFFTLLMEPAVVTADTTPQRINSCKYFFSKKWLTIVSDSITPTSQQDEPDSVRQCGADSGHDILIWTAAIRRKLMG